MAFVSVLWGVGVGGLVTEEQRSTLPGRTGLVGDLGGGGGRDSSGESCKAP